MLLGVEGNSSQAFLIVPQDTDMAAMVPAVEKKLPPLIKVLDDGPKSLRVSVLVRNKKEYKDVATVNSNMDVNVVNITNSTVKELTELLCRDFCADAWFGNVWEKDAFGTVRHRGVMHGSMQHSPTPMCLMSFTMWNTGACFTDMAKHAPVTIYGRLC